ncbi:MAG TPA: GIY-YIG nuclease family protein [Blastocatellia bacterium]|nr:GIY-YIG nuclease family protein [Blastocatellia bacterium]
MDKQHIINEIIRTTEKNEGRPLGSQRFSSETGIKKSDWYGKYWARWGDALKEAGYSPNTMQDSYDEDWLIEQLISLIKEIGRFPVHGELRLKARKDKNFPSHSTFGRLGNKAEAARKILDYCRQKSGYDDVIGICQPIASVEPKDDGAEGNEGDSDLGYVYLIKSGRYYKIGRSNFVGRREYELSIQLPEKVTIVHSITTDDPVGIEAYWHKRFKDKRKNGEWFELTNNDIKAFKRRRFM